MQHGNTSSNRHISLENALRDDILDLEKISNHLAAMIRTHKKLYRFIDAVSKWEEDLIWLKEKYYDNSFAWPPIDHY